MGGTGAFGVVWSIGISGKGRDVNGDGDEAIDPGKLEGSDGKGRLGGGFFVGSSRRNLVLNQ